MPLSQRLVDFNKQIVLGEVGAAVGTPLAPWITARFTHDPNVISLAAVVGGLIAGSLFWLVTKFRDEHRQGAASLRRLAGHIAYYTPAAFVLGLVSYQPALFLVTRHLIVRGQHEALAAVIGQAVAFGLFLVAINLYRLALQRIAGTSL